MGFKNVMIIKILENCNVCNKYILTFLAHWDVLNYCCDFWLHFKDCNDKYCTCLGPYMKICLCEEKRISLQMINQKNVEYLSGNGCIKNSPEKGDRAVYVVLKMIARYY